jgi:hypothetical protein
MDPREGDVVPPDWLTLTGNGLSVINTFPTLSLESHQSNLSAASGPEIPVEMSA